MRLLIVAQAVDANDPVLGFFVRWIEGLAAKFESIEVICLKEGEHALPANVRVHSLGKEHGRPLLGSLAYTIRFFRLVWQLREEYDAVFVHMNQEYVLLAGALWKALKKPIYMWRNHYAGTLSTDIAALFCTKIFCTSRHSYTAKYKRTQLMPVGVDLDRFHAASTARAPRSILFLARISPSKRPDLFVEGLGVLIEKGISFTASMYGSPLPEDERYYDTLKQRADELGLHDRLRFYSGVSHERAAQVFAGHEIFVNCSPSGMYDKTLFEAAASGCIVLASSDDFATEVGEESKFSNAEELAQALTNALEGRLQQDKTLAERHSLKSLMDQLAGAIIAPHE